MKNTSLSSRVIQYTYQPSSPKEKSDIYEFLANCKPFVSRKIKNYLRKKLSIKTRQVVKVILAKQVFDPSDGTVALNKLEVYFSSRTANILHKSQVTTALYKSHSQIIQQLEDFVSLGSGYILFECLYYYLELYAYNSLNGGGGANLLPLKIKNKRCTLSVENTGQWCFLYSILAALHPAELHPERKKHYQDKIHSLKAVRPSMRICDLPKFERENGISVNVFSCTKTGKLYVVRLTKIKKPRVKHVNLFLYKNHYFLIKHMSRLLSSTKSRNRSKGYYCSLCLAKYRSRRTLQVHMGICNTQSYRLPQPGSKIAFNNFKACFAQSFVYYIDAECINQIEHQNLSEKTTQLGKQIPFCLGIYKVCRSNDKYTSKQVKIFKGRKCIQHLVQYLNHQAIVNEIILKRKQEPLKMKPRDWKNYREAKCCSLCKSKFSKQNKKTAHHDHLKPDRSNLISIVCSRCNLQLKDRPFYPVIAHSLSNYDGKLILQEIHRMHGDISVIPKSSENFLSFRVGKFVFLDSFKFLPASLKVLSINLKNSGLQHFKHTAKIVECEEDLEMVAIKGALPYDWLSNFDKLEQTKLPPYNDWYNSLKQEHISPQTYDICRKIWDKFGCETVYDYILIYLSLDCLLLSDIYERYRSLCIQHFNLDPIHFYSSAGLSYNAALKMLKHPLELISDRTQLECILSGIRGGLATVGETLYAEANNPYCANYDPKCRTSYLAYLDLTNAYGRSLMQPLPYKHFRWLGKSDVKQFDVLHVPRASKTGYICDVSLQYPAELHDRDNSFPLIAHKKNIKISDLSPFTQSQCLDRQRIGERLVGSLENHKSYVLHYKYLQFLVSRGIKVLKYNRILAFTQGPIFKEYIIKNTLLRKKAKDKFEELLPKLMVVSLFGKCLQNDLAKMNVTLCTNKSKAEKLIARPNFKSGKIINKNLTLFNMSKVCVLLQKPVYVGQTVLDLAKALLYHRWSILQDYYGYRNCKLIYTDTDSIGAIIFTEDLYEDIKQVFFNIFDTSNYPKSSPLFSEKYKKVTGKLKDELAGQVPSHMVALKPKCWSLKIEQGSIAKAKGISTKNLRFNHYRNALFNNSQTTDTRIMFQSQNLKILKLEKSKVGLDKLLVSRYVLPPDGIKTLAFGHYKIP